ncbi:hypothetical protein ON010_g17928 [Phytophthora cinnamomi]|nr:hypothetical protein ON010_g17928 [Phytophthora cinnamomi]
MAIMPFMRHNHVTDYHFRINLSDTKSPPHRQHVKNPQDRPMQRAGVQEAGPARQSLQGAWWWQALLLSALPQVRPNQSQGAGFCIAHGGGCRCKVSGCKKFVQAQRYCRTHGRQFLSTATMKRKSTKSKFSADSTLNVRSVDRQQRAATKCTSSSTPLPFTASSTSPGWSTTGRWICELPLSHPVSTVDSRAGELGYDDKMVFPPYYPRFATSFSVVAKRPRIPAATAAADRKRNDCPEGCD